MNEQKRIYMDYAAATPLDPRVKSVMEPFWDDIFANPGGLHKDALLAKDHLEKSRQTISRILDVNSSEIFFTSGGTESNSLALIGFLNYLEDREKLKGRHIITSVIEHPSVLDVFKKYKKKGLEVELAPVTGDGLVDLDKLGRMVKEDTSLVSIVYVNSELGTVQPLKKISNLIKKKNPGVVFHTDASQAPVFLEVKAPALGVDMMSLDGQKIYGPKGVGVLYKNSSVNISPVLLGGGQEGGLRPGTENTPLVVGMAKAFEIIESERLETVKSILPLRDYFVDSLLALSDKVILNGGREQRSAGNINISVIGEDSEFLFIKLDKAGVSCATKSTCIGEKEEGSYVLKALGNPNVENGLRFSLGRSTTKEEIDKVIEIFSGIISK